MSTKRTSSMRAAAARLGRPGGRSAGLVLGLGLCAGFILASALLLSCQKEERTNPLDPKGVRAGSDPFGLTASLVGDHILLEWERIDVASVAGYRVYRRAVPDVGWGILDSVDSDSTSHTDTNVEPGSRYEYKVNAFDSENRDAAESIVVPVTISTLPVLKIAGGALQTPTRQVTLLIQAAGGQQMRLANEGEDIRQKSWVQFAGTRNWELTQGPGTKRVSLQVRYGESDTSAVVTEEVQPDSITNTSVTIAEDAQQICHTGQAVSLTVAASGAHSVRVANSENDLEAASWIRFTDRYTPEGDWQLTDGLGEKRVWAEFKNDFFTDTQSGSVVVVDPPGTPTDVDADGDCGQITVSWSQVQSATGYRVYRGNDTNLVREVAGGTTLSWPDQNPPDGAHRYWVSAVIDSCEGEKRGTTASATADCIPQLVTIPAGTFTMGDGEAYCGRDQREVTLTKSFRLGKYEVTNAEYARALQWAYDQTPRLVDVSGGNVIDNAGSTRELLRMSYTDCRIAFSNGRFSVTAGWENHPVVRVTWFGAAAFCNWLSLMEGLTPAYTHSGDWPCNNGNPYTAQGYRLPTDAEWEYAARHNNGRIYPWGNVSPTCSRANYSGCGGLKAVGSHPTGVSALGLHDMAGNVYEWCNDWHQCYLGTSAATNPTGPGSGDCRVLRGGSWFSHDIYLRCAIRTYYYPDYAYTDYGFRLARTIIP